MTTQQLHQQIDYYSRQLRLPAFRSEYQLLAESTAKDNGSFEKFLSDLTQVSVVEFN